MHDPLSVCGDYQLAIGCNHPGHCTSAVQHSYKMTPSDFSRYRPDMLEGVSLSCHSMLPSMNRDSHSNAVASSVWLEQGEYFFDDEFAAPYDGEVNDCLPDTTVSSTPADFDTSSNGELPRNSRHLEQSCCDSCINTPGDSCDSTQNGQTSTSLHSINASGCNHLVGNLHSFFHPGVENQFFCDKRTVKNTNEECEESRVLRSVSNGISEPRLLDGSQISGQSSSTSWMQMIMERSCNPDLKALLSRAAAVDYKLAYTDLLPPDSSTGSVRQAIHEKSADLLKRGSLYIPRSSSQSNLLTAASLAGLRNALDQATKLFPPLDPTSTSEMVSQTNDTGDSGTLQADFGKPFTHTEISKFTTTTWAQKRTSRESLRRRKQEVNSTVLPYSSAESENSSNFASHDSTNPWRAMKEANGALITWNQFKRTVKKCDLTGRPIGSRESRREQHGRRKNDLQNDREEPDQGILNVTSDTQLLDCFRTRPSTRSRSQPVSSNHYMYRFSGTLLEIFMRAKELACSGHESFPKASTADACRNSYVLDGRFHVCGGGVHSTEHDSGGGNQSLLHVDRPCKVSADDFAVGDENTDARCTRHFGTQFPPLDSSTVAFPLSPPRSFSPTWSTAPSTRRSTAAGRILINYGVDTRGVWPHGRPHSLGCNKRFLDSPSDSKSTDPSPEFATCLTASAGPDSPYMAALRADYVAGGFSAGWLGNPRASIAYPGLGLLSIPRPSRLASAAFLSHTLPDLSFLGQAVAEEERKGTPTMPKRLASERRRGHSAGYHCCSKCGCRASSVGRTKCFRGAAHLETKPRKPESKPYTFSSGLTEPNSVPSGTKTKITVATGIPDLVAGHPNSSIQRSNSDKSSPSPSGQKSKQTATYDQSIDYDTRSNRCNSEPDLNSALLNSDGRFTTHSIDFASYEKPSSLMTSSSQACYGWDSNKSSAIFDRACRPKKSVSFSGKIRQLRTRIGRQDGSKESPSSPEPKVIPRNWGLYGRETPLAEFNPRISPGRDQPGPSGDVPVQSDVDVRYHAMVNDVIKAVQETIAYYSTAGELASTAEPLPYSTAAALGSAGRQPLLAVCGPLTVLLSDGLLPPSRPIFMSKPRTRLWQMVEESCRPGPLLSGVTFRVLSDAVSQVKALASVTLERAKFKAFLCACLNAKALPMWLNAVVANEPLLGRFYCADAFVRQCRSTLRGLYADLLTHLEQLLAFPFNLDIAVEARKPLIDPNSPVTRLAAPSGSSQPVPVASSSLTGQAAKIATRSGTLPTIVMTRRNQLVDTGNGPSGRNRFSPAPVGSTSGGGVNVHHYFQNHLPGQRSVSGRPVPKSTLSGVPLADDSGGSSSASSETNPSAHSKLPPRRPAIANQPVPTAPGRMIKTALSSFRRSNVQVTPTSEKPEVAYHSTGIPVAETSSKSTGKAEPTQRPRAPLTSESGRIRAVSKLKPPNTVINSQR